ncbi:MAG: VCBS repeat-containing protein, partial [Planctomycetales bacterium]|nr:VCBS repeat-containing protein [Planctomycetales bacterium]
YQRQFNAGAPEHVRQGLQRHARGNTLFHNRGGAEFDDVTIDAAVNMGRWAWGSQFVDINNDGWEDLVVANGFITAPDEGDL